MKCRTIRAPENACHFWEKRRNKRMVRLLMIIKSRNEVQFLSRCGGMADAQDSKSCEGSFMRVRPPPPAPNHKKRTLINF